MVPEQTVLKLLLTTPDRDSALESLAILRQKHFSETLVPIYKAIVSFYNTQGHCPTLQELELKTSRFPRLQRALKVLEAVKVPDVTLDLAVESLIEEYAQNVSLDLLVNFIDKVTQMDLNEMKEAIGSLSFKLEEEVGQGEAVYTSKDCNIFKSEEEINFTKVVTCISNAIDTQLGGLFLEHLVLIGGRRGSGKSLLGINICERQQESGYIAPFFTIEMDHDETFQRFMAVRTGVILENIKLGKLSCRERVKLAQARAEMHEGGVELLAELDLTEPEHFLSFEKRLVKLPEKDSIPVIIDSRELTLAAIDVHLGKLKNKYGSRMQLAVIDYINIVNTGNSRGSDVYDWKEQIEIAKQLKALARKYKIVIVSPYQISATGEARFSQGILDSADSVITLTRDRDAENKNTGEGRIILETVKVRGGRDDIVSVTGINWNTLRIEETEVGSLEEDESSLNEVQFEV